MKIAKIYIFSGHVQGVGFRMTVASIAQPLDLFGYVKNLKDKTVELHIEGKKEEVEKLLKKIKQEMGTYISSIEDRAVKEKNFKSFSIQR